MAENTFLWLTPLKPYQPKRQFHNYVHTYRYLGVSLGYERETVPDVTFKPVWLSIALVTWVKKISI